jgi:hypothetical protein
MKKLLLVITVLSSFFSNGQEFSSKEEKRMGPVLKRSTSTIRSFNKDALISIERTNYPEIEGLVENALFTAGLKVVSNKVAKDAVTISNPLSSKNDTIQVSRSTEFKSVYLITVNGSFYQGALIGRCQEALISFTGRVVDLADEGKIVGVFKYSGNALTYVACLEDVANAFVFSLLDNKQSKK